MDPEKCTLAQEVYFNDKCQHFSYLTKTQNNKNTPWQKTNYYIKQKKSLNEIDNENAEHVSGKGELNVFDIRNQKDLQINFPQELLYERLWATSAQQLSKDQTVIIFDWDDTLLCTSFLKLCRGQALSDAVQRHVQEIEAAVKNLLELAMQLGHTFIITNATHGWVEYSATKWVPDLLPVLQKVQVISARTKYESQFPGEVSKWKIQAFLDVQKQFDWQMATNLISLGDSSFEMDALEVMGKEFAQAVIKTIKFEAKPSPEDLLRQLQLVNQKFERIVENARNLNIGFSDSAQQGWLRALFLMSSHALQWKNLFPGCCTGR